jgi:hypothetical protein
MILRLIKFSFLSRVLNISSYQSTNALALATISLCLCPLVDAGTPAANSAKSPKRENTFSKSRDLREVRGTREMKTTHNPQTLPHAK